MTKAQLYAILATVWVSPVDPGASNVVIGLIFGVAALAYSLGSGK